MKTPLCIAIAAVTAALTLPALAADEHNTVPGLTAAGKPLAFHGVDPVAFIQIGNRVKGTAKFTSAHEGVAYYFATRTNMVAFRRDPGKYIPQYGGFCAFGVSVAKKFDGDPQYADVMNGKLYVFLSEEIFRSYQKDKPGTIAKAEANWQKIQNTSALSL